MRVNERPAITNHWQQRLTTGRKQGDSNALKNTTITMCQLLNAKLQTTN